MRFFELGLVASMATAVSAAAIATQVNVAFVTELVYVDTAGHTLSQQLIDPTAAIPAPANPTDTETAVDTATNTATDTKTSTSTTTTSTTTVTAPTNQNPGPSAPTAGPASPNGCADASSFYTAAASLCDGATDHDYCVKAVGTHNLHRANHSASALKWDAQLAAWAQQHTDQCYFSDYLNDNGVEHQSNAYVASGMVGDAQAATHSWYDEQTLFAEHGLYGQADPPKTVLGPDGNQHEIGHFANVVYQRFTVIGCATTSCQSVTFPPNADGSPSKPWANADLTLCFYNSYDYDNDYQTNVKPSLGCAAYDQN